ncbi:MAG: hypothetical protein P8P36_04565 [Akkermansiaceae bacterium]|nr:hypothetical protein [Akkermansiaceae bacterium]
MKAGIIGLVGALVIGGAGGFMVGKKSTPSADNAADDEARSARRNNESSLSYSSARSAEPSDADKGKRGPRVDSAADAMSLPGQNNRLRSLMDYYAGLGPSEFKEEAEKLEELPWSERIMVGYLLFARWGEEDPTAAMAYTKTMGFTGVFVKKTVVQSWASKRPQEAADYYAANASDFRMGSMMGGRGRGGGSAASVIAMEWARQDSEGAMTWAKSLEASDQSDAMKGIFRQAATDDPARAAGMLGSITDDKARESAQNTIAREWGGKDWNATKSWIAGLPSDQQEAATAGALRGLADADAAAAAAEIGSLSEGNDPNDTMRSIARKWGRDDPKASAEWVMENGNESSQAQSIGSVMSSWASKDPVAALDFVNEQEEGKVRDSAASSFVIANQAGDIAQNIRLAETIGDEGMRRRAIGITATAWMRQDKEAAGQYLDTTEALSDKSRQRIKRFAEGGGH